MKDIDLDALAYATVAFEDHRFVDEFLGELRRQLAAGQTNFTFKASTPVPGILLDPRVAPILEDAFVCIEQRLEARCAELDSLGLRITRDVIRKVLMTLH